MGLGRTRPSPPPKRELGRLHQHARVADVPRARPVYGKHTGSRQAFKNGHFIQPSFLYGVMVCESVLVFLNAPKEMLSETCGAH